MISGQTRKSNSDERARIQNKAAKMQISHRNQQNFGIQNHNQRQHRNKNDAAKQNNLQQA